MVPWFVEYNPDRNKNLYSGIVIDSVLEKYWLIIGLTKNLGELITYDFTMPDGPKCGDIQNTCGRALCECDKQFATEHNEHKDVYNQDFSYIISGFNSQEICRECILLWTVLWIRWILFFERNVMVISLNSLIFLSQKVHLIILGLPSFNLVDLTVLD